jgi:hypothetical protein
VHRADFGVEVVGSVHASTIGRGPRAFNAIVLLLLLVAAGAGAADVPRTDGRIRVGGVVDGLAVVDTGSGARQRPEGRLTVEAEARLQRRLRLVTEARGRIGGPFEGGPGAGAYDFRRAYQNRSPALELRQAFLEHRGRRVDTVVGIQTFAWGKLDGVPPTDVLNPRDFHDPIIRDVEDRKIGVPAASLTYYPSLPRGWGVRDPRLTVVWIPFAVPSRLAEVEERWFPTSTAIPDRIPVRSAVLDTSVHIDEFRTESDPPPRTIGAGGLALRVGATSRAVDWALYHYSGPETGPNLDLEGDLRLRRPASGLAGGLAADARLVQAHDVFHMTGADAAFVVGPVAFRAEVAHFLDRPMLRVAADLVGPGALADAQLVRLVQRVLDDGSARVPLGDLFPDQDVLEWGVGADGLWRGWHPLVQVSQVIILDGAPRLLVADPETRALARLSRRWIDDRLTTEMRFLWAIERGSWFAQPAIFYEPRDDVRVGVGYLAIGGTPKSLIGQFQGNDQVYLEARWSF